MIKNRRLFLAVLFLVSLFFLLYLCTYAYLHPSGGRKSATIISVIVYGSSNDRWNTLKQGLDQACADFGAEINFITMTSENDAKEQETLLEREISSGTKGIILAVADSGGMTSAVRKAARKIPVVTVETEAKDTEGILYISSDNYSMGLNIARAVPLVNDKGKKIAVFMDNQNRSSVSERYSGVIDYLKNTDYQVSAWKAGRYDNPLLYLQSMMKADPADIIIALDDSSLETVIDAAVNEQKGIGIYGIGCTSKIVHYLDNGLVNSIVFQNEFNMGYLSVQEILNEINKKKVNHGIEIESRTLNKDTMYLPANQRLVFPIVQ